MEEWEEAYPVEGEDEEEEGSDYYEMGEGSEHYEDEEDYGSGFDEDEDSLVIQDYSPPAGARGALLREAQGVPLGACILWCTWLPLEKNAPCKQLVHGLRRLP